MPIIGSSGALSVIKNAAIGVNNYWLIEFNSNAIATANFIIGNSNDVYLVGRKDIGPDVTWFNAKITQDFGTPTLNWENNLSGPNDFNYGYTNFFDSATNQLYTAGYNSIAGADTTDGTIAIVSPDNIIINQYVDYSNVTPGRSSTNPWLRVPTNILTASNGSFWTTGALNDKPNNTTNRYRVYLTNSTGNVKNRQIVFTDSTIGTQGIINDFLYDNSGNLLININYPGFTLNQSFVSLVNYDVANNAINWEYRLQQATTATRIRSSFTKTPDGNIFVLYTRPFNLTNTGFYFYKFASTGTVTWSRKINITGATTFGQGYLTYDNNNNIYVLLPTGPTVNTTYMIKFDTNYNIIWQRVLTGISDCGTIKWNKNNLYIQCLGNNSKSVVIKLPDDGTLTGTYTIPSSTSLTYSVTTAASTTSDNAGIPSGSGFSIANATSTIMNAFSFGSNITTSNTSYKIIP